MASKKCPKCGEDNPAEAVMCWACYTPLSGGPAIAGMNTATAALGAKGPIGKSAVGVPTVEEDSAKKGVDPKLIGVGAFLVIAGVIAFLVNSSMGGGTSDDTLLTSTDSGNVQMMSPGSGSSAPQSASAPSLGSSSSSSNSSSAPAPVALQFRTVTTPDPRNPTGTVGILIAADKQQEAAGFARYAKSMLMRNGRWQNMQVCVFIDQKTANQFKQFQGPRKGKPLGRNEFAALASAGVWNSTPVFYESRGKSERIFKPSESPNGWWSSV